MGAAGVLLHLLVDPLGYVRGQDLHEGGGGQSPHGVVLDGSSRQVGVSHEGKVVDCPAVKMSVSQISLTLDSPDEGPEVLLVVVSRHHLLQMLQLGGVHSPVPLQLVLALV